MDEVKISRNVKALEEALQELDKNAHKTGLITNQEISIYMRVSKKTHNQCQHTAIGG